MERKDIRVENFNEFSNFSTEKVVNRTWTFWFWLKKFSLRSVHRSELISIKVIVIAISARHWELFLPGRIISAFSFPLRRAFEGFLHQICLTRRRRNFKLRSILKSLTNNDFKLNKETSDGEIKLFFDCELMIVTWGLHELSFRKPPAHIYDSRKHRKLSSFPIPIWGSFSCWFRFCSLKHECEIDKARICYVGASS